MTPSDAALIVCGGALALGAASSRRDARHGRCARAEWADRERDGNGAPLTAQTTQTLAKAFGCGALHGPSKWLFPGERPSSENLASPV